MAGWGPVGPENEVREQRHEETQRSDGRSSLGTAEECCGGTGERACNAHIRGGERSRLFDVGAVAPNLAGGT